MKIPVLLSVIPFIFFIKSSLSQDSEDKPESEETRVINSGRGGLIAFKPFGDDVNFGLDILVPFVKVPSVRALRDKKSKEALLTVNTASITMGGIISAIGIFVGHILRSLITLRGRENVAESNDDEIETKSQSAEHRLDFDIEGSRFKRMLEPVKLVYRNSSGERVDTSFGTLFNTIEETFLENNIDLSACWKKALCLMIQRAYTNIENGTANGIEKMIDGFSHLNWLMNLMHKTAIEDAILAGKTNTTENCLFKYSACIWDTPEEEIYEILTNRIKFA